MRSAGILSLCALSLGLLLSAPAMSGAGGQAADIAALLAEYRRPEAIPAPRDNPITPAKVELGKALFFDPRLSDSGIISCATCHNPSLGWADGLPKGVGHLGARLGRHTPTILNVAWGEPFFWDGRAQTLEEQAKGPMLSTAEMHTSIDDAIARLRRIPGYVRLFDAAYPGKGISLDTMAAAIASYERTVVSGPAPFDRWVAGDATAVDAAAQRGFVLFNGKARCAACHAGWRFSDDGFHDIGLADKDPGRSAVAPGIVQLQHAFKTPTLRNVSLHGPYMHDGSVATLAGVIDHYDHGFVRRPSLDAEMVPLHLTAAEKRDLLAFLGALTSDDEPVRVPMLPQ